MRPLPAPLRLAAALLIALPAAAAEPPCGPSAAATTGAGERVQLQPSTDADAEGAEVPEAGDCRIGSAALAQAPWSRARWIDLRSADERQRQPLPEAMALRRSDLSPALLASLDLPILLLGGGTDDLGLQRQCAELQAALGQPVAVLGGGVPAILAAQPQAPAQPALALTAAGLAGLLADPSARLLVAEDALPADLAVRAQLQPMPRRVSARSLQRALQPLQDAATQEGGSVAVVFADASAESVALVERLHAPVWTWAQGPEALSQWLLRQREQLAAQAPLAPETCRWN